MQRSHDVLNVRRGRDEVARSRVEAVRVCGRVPLEDIGAATFTELAASRTSGGRETIIAGVDSADATSLTSGGVPGSSRAPAAEAVRPAATARESAVA